MRKSIVCFKKLINKRNIQKYIHKFLCLLFIFINLQLFADKPVVISLGFHCAVARALKDHDIRTVAYPFDWGVFPFAGLYQVFEEDFEGFLLKENLSILSTSPRFVIDSYTGFKYNHDFSTIGGVYAPGLEEEQILAADTIVDHFLDDYDFVKDKYVRRIERLQAVLNSSEKIVLIRFLIKRQEAIDLLNLLQTKYPLADLTLIAINVGGENDLSWDELNIKNYYFPLNVVEDSQSAEWLNVLYENDLLP